MSEKTLAQRIGAPSVPTAPDHAAVTWRTAAAGDVDAIHAVYAAADAVDHPSWITPREDIADTFALPHIDHSRDTIVATDSEGALVAVGSAFLHPSRDEKLTVHLYGAVHPEWRRCGIGTAVLNWQRARGLEQLAELAPTLGDGQWPADLKVYAEEPNTDEQAIAARAGFTAERWFSTMERDMTAPAPIVSTPDGITVVAYSQHRAMDALAARNDAFRDHWGSLPSQPESWLQFVGGPFIRPDLSRVALDGNGAIVAFCLASVNEDDWAALGATHAYIDLIGVVRSHRRRGLAPLVIAGTLAAIADAGLERAVLDVDTASPTGANTLYEGLGFIPTERSVALVLHV